MKYGLKTKLNIIVKSLIIITMVIFLENQTNNVVLNSQNINLNKKLNLNSFAVLDITDTTYSEPLSMEIKNEEVKEKPADTQEVPIAEVKQPVVEEQPKLASFSGKMTGYVYNCPGCSGKLACDSSIDLSNGNITYNDMTYGNVRIVASSNNLPCGTIVSIKADKLSSEPITAIVLDRGVGGTKLDLLSASVSDARTQIGNTNITYDVLRNGF